MKKIRIGNDIRIKFPVELSEGRTLDNTLLHLSVWVKPSGEIVDYENYRDPIIMEEDRLVLGNSPVDRLAVSQAARQHHRDARRKDVVYPVKLDYNIVEDEGNLYLIAVWGADKQFAVGEYDVVLYNNFNGRGQSAVDQCRCVRLVSHTVQTDDSYDESVNALLEFEPLTLRVDAMNAWELAVAYGKTALSEEDYISNIAEMNDSFNLLEEELKAKYENHITTLEERVTRCEEMIEELTSDIAYSVICIDKKTGAELRKNVYFGKANATILVRADEIAGWQTETATKEITLVWGERNSVTFEYDRLCNVKVIGYVEGTSTILYQETKHLVEDKTVTIDAPTIQDYLIVGETQKTITPTREGVTVTFYYKIGVMNKWGFGTSEITSANMAANTKGETRELVIDIPVNANAKSVFVFVPTLVVKRVTSFKNTDTHEELKDSAQYKATNVEGGIIYQVVFGTNVNGNNYRVIIG